MKSDRNSIPKPRCGTEGNLVLSLVTVPTEPIPQQVFRVLVNQIWMKLGCLSQNNNSQIQPSCYLSDHLKPLTLPFTTLLILSFCSSN